MKKILILSLLLTGLNVHCSDGEPSPAWLQLAELVGTVRSATGRTHTVVEPQDQTQRTPSPEPAAAAITIELPIQMNQLNGFNDLSINDQRTITELAKNFRVDTDKVSLINLLESNIREIKEQHIVAARSSLPDRQEHQQGAAAATQKLPARQTSFQGVPRQHRTQTPSSAPDLRTALSTAIAALDQVSASFVDQPTVQQQAEYVVDNYGFTLDAKTFRELNMALANSKK